MRRRSHRPPDWSGGPGKAKFRIDGLDKVTGRKIYARDFRARDLDGWPDTEEVVLIARTPIADRIFLGLDLSRLPKELIPTKTVTAENLKVDRTGLAKSDYPEGDYLLPKNKVPDYLGQAVGLLYFDDYHTMDKARREIRSDMTTCLVFGDEVPADRTKYYAPETSIIHVKSAAGKEVFSQVSGGPVRPQLATTKRDIEAMGWVDRIREKFEGRRSPGLEGHQRDL
ncbi:hypothetical protein [uncultured Roseibium sp.]|uniref:hypothetical protein n=1 Tax=uncultured Roseibium sp. TaxID=1936171 RepID=UPI00321674F9